MKLFQTAAVLLYFGGATLAAQQEAPQQASQSKTGAQSAQKITTPTSDRGNLSDDERQFIQEASRGGHMEVDMSEAAKSKASDKKVKELAEVLVRDHGKSNTELTQLAIKNGVDLFYPDDAARGSANTAKSEGHPGDELAAYSGADYDRHYVERQVEDHRKMIDKFEAAHAKATDPDLKKFIQQTLPTLRSHLSKAESIEHDLVKK